MLVNYINTNHKHSFGENFKININHINDLARHASSAGIRKDLNKLLITMYVNAIDFDAADSLFSQFIRPFIDEFNSEDINLLIERIGHNNQTHWRGRANSDHKIIVDKALEVLDGFEASAYNFLPGNQ